MDQIRKNRILRAINQMPVDDLWDLIINDGFTIEEMNDAGLDGVMATKLKEKKIQQTEIIRATAEKAEAEAAENQSTEAAEAKKEGEIIELCKRVESGKLGIEDIQKELRENPNLENFLLSYTSLTIELIERIKKYSKSSTEFDSWENSPALESNRTDVFFFGQPGSGKSCVLASLFHYFEKTGIMMSNMSNPVGVKYRNQLVNEISNGVLPHGTQRDKLNFIPIELRDKKDSTITHPLNFIEMSGELFKEAASDGFENPDLVKLKSYLDNGNRKLIFFVLDYFQHTSKVGGHKQGGFSDFLQWLDDMKILDKTDGIYILLTKADLFPENVEPKNYALQFLDQEFLSFKENAKAKKAKYRDQFKIFLFPYSIGKVKFQDLLTSIDLQHPSYICDAIMRHSFVSKKSFLGKLFNN